MKRWFIGLMLLGVIVAACGGAAQPGVKLGPVSQLPPQIQKAPVKVREAYQFAIANPDLLKPIPCYCGCGSVGHTSNLDCYVKEFKSDGSIVFDDHAFG